MRFHQCFGSPISDFWMRLIWQKWAKMYWDSIENFKFCKFFIILNQISILEPNFFLAFKMAFWCQKVKKSQKVKFSMEYQYIFAHFCQKSLIQKSGFRLPKHWWNLIGKWGVSFPGRVGGCSVQFENSFVYIQAASQILLSSSPASGERRGGEGCSLPATHQNGRSTISNISGNSWDLQSHILWVIGNFTLQ